jgi:hypothetical protein
MITTGVTGAVIAVLTLAILGCSSAPARQVGGDGATARWSEEQDGLQIRLELPASAQRIGTTVQARLHVPIRLYFIVEEPFRGFQSRLAILRPDTRERLSVQPEPLPHGYVVTERDFPLLEPGATRAFAQSLDLPASALGSGGSFVVEWTYENEIERWTGGVQTLDGPTQELFGGERIPHIWTGRLAVTADLLVASP